MVTPTFELLISRLEVMHDEDNQDIITDIHWKIVLTDTDGYFDQERGHFRTKYDPTSFKPYDKLTESEIISWLQQSPTFCEDEIKNRMLLRYNQQQSKPKALPWR